MTTEEKFIKSAKQWIEDIDEQIDELSTRRGEIKESIQAACTHPNIQDLKETYGTHNDNGYGHWWRNPYFRCEQCGSVDEGYDARRLNQERQERCHSGKFN